MLSDRQFVPEPSRAPRGVAAVSRIGHAQAAVRLCRAVEGVVAGLVNTAVSPNQVYNGRLRAAAQFARPREALKKGPAAPAQEEDEGDELLTGMGAWGLVRDGSVLSTAR